MLISGVYIFIKNHASSGNNFSQMLSMIGRRKFFFYVEMGNTNEEGKISDILGKMY